MYAHQRPRSTLSQLVVALTGFVQLERSSVALNFDAWSSQLNVQMNAAGGTGQEGMVVYID